jgi:CheY-like chemotaxis protein
MIGSRKILVVDDESSIRCLLSDILSCKGFEVTEAKDGQESLEQMEKTDFDLVITDIHMPRLDGIAMLEQMDKAGRKEKVIIMTGNPSDQRILLADMPRIVTQLLKPFRISNLLDVVIAATANTGYMTGTENHQQAADRVQ